MAIVYSLKRAVMANFLIRNANVFDGSGADGSGTDRNDQCAKDRESPIHVIAPYPLSNRPTRRR